ncbi:hypothetical protein A4G99_18645 [Haladaptatus sp. R4]|nr:hypothetical protein A4G99_18645 [Haladaptatus sp. R4]
MINGHVGGRYLDDEFFWSVFDRAESLDVPLYIHPTPPSELVVDTLYTGNFSTDVTDVLSTAGWGWHIDTATHVLRLVLSGVFDRYPDLEIVIGHLGEGLASMLARIESVFDRDLTGLDEPVGRYFRRNLHYTISGFNTVPTFENLVSLVGADRITFSADYPFASMEDAREFLGRLPISPADRRKIAHKNAERLLGL